MELLDLKGLGENSLSYLNKKGIYTFNDLITFYPINYQMYSNQKLVDGANIKIQGTISRKVSEYRPRFNLIISTYFISDGTEEYKIVAFNQKHLKYTINVGEKIKVMGKYDAKKNQIVQKEVKKLEDFEIEDKSNEIKPVYSKIERLSSEQVKKIILNAISYIDDKEYKLNLLKIHNPENFEELEKGREFLKYKEFKEYYKKLLKSKDNKKNKSIDFIKNVEEKDLDYFIKSLEFSLTEDQISVINNIFNSFKLKTKTQTLVLGDVGSGKTIVAISLIYTLIKKGYQVALMAPTELLANQLYDNCKKYLGEFEIDLLTSSKTKREKNRIKDNVMVGFTKVLVGTHAILEDDVIFDNLAVAIIDEQHRFGVDQRNKLINKTLFREFIYLSATPIPRTLAQGIFGVMEVESIKNKPKNRKQVQTEIFTKKNRKEMFLLLEEELNKNNQAFIVAPTIEETEIENLENVENIYESMKTFYKDKYKVGLIHGQMKSHNKDIIMEKFKNKEYDILVATTVIEVGVDIKDATVIMIVNAERYGLAQLHQLRGRVGRNDKQSYCLLYDKSNNDISKKRLETLKEHDNGFVLANKDLELRGSGSFFGKEQSGSTNFKLFDYYNDQEIAKKVIEENKKLKK